MTILLVSETSITTLERGGGISNTGTLTLINSTIRNNQALGSPGNNTMGDARGGAILNSATGTVNIINSSVRDNTASASRAYGGGLYGGNFNITNSAITGNFASGGFNTPSMSAGGGIYGGNLVIANSTISNNKSSASNMQNSPTGGGGINGGGILRNSTVSGNSHTCGSECGTYDYVFSPGRYAGGIMGGFTISNTIVAMNGFDVSGGVNSEGYNIIGRVGASSGWLSTDILNQDPKLAPLADNGGQTQTQALLAGSPAINAGNNADAPATDQGGFARIVGGTIDIGAYESDTPACTYTPSATSASFGAAASGGTFTISANGGCAWSAVSNNDWITVNLGASWSGSGTVGFTLAANLSGTARTGSISVGGQTFTVNQASGCTFTPSATEANFATTGGNNTFTISANGGCEWHAVSQNDWITINLGASWSGSGTVAYTVAANPTTVSRTGTVTVAGQTFTVNQAGATVKSRKRVRFF